MPNKPIPYAQTGRNDYEWTKKAFDLLTQGLLSVTITGKGDNTAVHASGVCPRCAHDVNYTRVEKIAAPTDASILGGGERGGQRVTAPAYVTVEAACACQDQEHPGRPKDILRGCGIVFAAEVLVTP